MVSPHTIALFTGAFKLLNVTRLHNGTSVLDTTSGRHPDGVLSYSTNGYVSVLIHATESEWRPSNLTMLDHGSEFDAQWALVGKHSGAYAGPFHFNESSIIDDTHGEVLHGPLVAASLPAQIGQTQRRKFTFSDDGLYLRLEGELGSGVIDILWWERICENHTAP